VCDALVEIFHELDQSGTPATILFPWFPWWERMRRFYLMKRFYDIMTAAIEARRTEGRDDEDPMQYLIDEGLSSLEITQVRFLPTLPERIRSYLLFVIFA
jgi:sterol 14-demethylase